MPTTISEAMVNGVLADVSQDPNAVPRPPSMMEAYPKIQYSAAFKTLRGSNTILSGGSGVGQAANPMLTGWGATREGFAQANLTNPRNWRRFGTQDYFHHQGALAGRGSPASQMPRPGGRPGSGAQYNPFYVGAGINAVARGVMGEGKSGRFLLGERLANTLREKELLIPGREAVSKGFLSRVTAASRTMGQSDAAFARNASSIQNFLVGAGSTADAAQSTIAAGRGAAAGALLTSGGGSISGRIGGFLSAGTGATPIAPAAPLPAEHALFAAQRGQMVAHGMMDRIGLQAGQQYTARQMASAGLETARQATGAGAKAAAVGRGAALAGGRASMIGMRFVPYVGTALLVKDAVKFATLGIGKVAEVGVDAMKSFQGDLKTGIMGQRFTDTEATMTSRSRGVQAIQNSRLNARSILGSEAGSMHAHFG